MRAPDLGLDVALDELALLVEADRPAVNTRSPSTTTDEYGGACRSSSSIAVTCAPQASLERAQRLMSASVA